MVWEGQIGQVIDLIQMIANLVEPLVGQRLGSVELAFEILLVSMQIGLGWVALVKIGLE